MEQPVVRVLLTVIIVISSTLVGVAGVWLAKQGGMSLPNAILTGAGGFGVTVSLLLAIAHFLRGT